ncbi:MAG: hypothetical protein ACRC62_38285 [Microcoleus sp.]
MTEDLNQQPGQETEEDEKFDLALFYRKHRKQLKQDCDYEITLPLGQEIERLFRKVVVLPGADFAYKILSAYALLPSIACEVLPILYVQGGEGSGKSQILKLFQGLTGCETQSGASTAASLKNEINPRRWRDPGTFSLEKNYFLLIDNANSDMFDYPQTLSVFLNGYDRSTDLLTIAGEKGQNLRFYTFGPKVVSSVHEISQPELLRRCLLIQCKKCTNEQGATIEQLSSLPINLIQKAIADFWINEVNAEALVGFQIDIKSTRRKFKELSIEQWNLLSDLIAVGIVGSVWSLEEAVSGFVSYLKFQFQSKTKTLLASIILEALVTGTGLEQSEWIEASKRRCVYCQPKLIKEACKREFDAGMLAKMPSQDTIQSILKILGFRPAKTERGYLYQYVGEGG